MTESKTLLKLDATLDNLLPVKDAVSAAARAAGYPDIQLLRIEVVVEEAYLNVVHHAYHDRGGEVVIVCELNDQELFQVTIMDYADYFEIPPVSSRSGDESIDVRQPGGCGMTLIRSMTKSAVWCREDDRNMLSMVFDKTAAPRTRK